MAIHPLIVFMVPCLLSFVQKNSAENESLVKPAELSELASHFQGELIHGSIKSENEQENLLPVWVDNKILFFLEITGNFL